MFQALSSKANRASLLEESAKSKITARDAARLDRQRKLAEVLRAKANAEELGEDVERAKNWEWTIEENDEWEKKLRRKKRRADFEFHGEFGVLSRLLIEMTLMFSWQTMHTPHVEDTRKISTFSSPTLLRTIGRKR